MSNLNIIAELKKLYENGVNISQYLKKDIKRSNTLESILISYDLQSGSYTEFAKNNIKYINEYSSAIGKTINGLGEFQSIMEVGVGEATIMCPLMKNISKNKNLEMYGFDLSWSRVRYSLKNSIESNLKINLFNANLFEIPLAENSIDIVYTSHSLEPNGGKEKQALEELYRVTNKYLVLLEPDYKNATNEGRNRMEKLGYVINLSQHAKELGYEVIKDESFGISVNALNPTRLTIIKKVPFQGKQNIKYICPISKSDLDLYKNFYYSKAGGLIYPVIQNIPSFLSTSAILGSHLHKFD
ncbi:hypothetical protein CL656_06870 [bacterium]|nr:hypothetical protein [bacterium]